MSRKKQDGESRRGPEARRLASGTRQTRRRASANIKRVEGFRTVEFSRRDGVATITLNRPEVLNAYNVEMRDDLFALFEAVARLGVGGT